jgi:transposase-like protein
VDELPGDPELKFRLKVVLATITGELLVAEACDELDLGPTQFANVRRQALLSALDGLRLRPAGRPRRTANVTPEEVSALRRRVAELERERRLLLAKLEVALLPLLQQRPKSNRRAPPAAAARPASAP